MGSLQMAKRQDVELVSASTLNKADNLGCAAIEITNYAQANKTQEPPYLHSQKV